MGDADPGAGAPAGGEGGNTDPGTGGTPAAGAPPAGAPATPPAARRPAQQQAATPKPFGPAEMKRIRQEASRILRKELGADVTLEQVKKLLAEKAAAGAAPAPGQPTQPQAPGSKEKKLLDEIAARDAAIAERDARIAKQNRRITKLKRRQVRESTRMEMRMEAKTAGVLDRYVDFAMAEYGNLFAAFSANPDGVAPEVKAAFQREPEVDGAAVFAYIRAQHPMIGQQPPAVVPISPTTAPPASRQPGETTPPVKQPGDKPKPFNAMELSDEEWAKYKRANGLP